MSIHKLNKYFVDSQDKHKLPVSISFTHIYFSMDKHGAKAFKYAKNVSLELKSSRAPERGDSFMLQYDFVQETPSGVARLLFVKSARCVNPVSKIQTPINLLEVLQ